LEKVGDRLENTTGVSADKNERATVAAALYYAHLESSTANNYSLLLTI